MEDAGRRLVYAGGSFECRGRLGPVGAVLPNGDRFDLGLPFGFPFTEVAVELWPLPAKETRAGVPNGRFARHYETVMLSTTPIYGVER